MLGLDQPQWEYHWRFWSIFLLSSEINWNSFLYIETHAWVWKCITTGPHVGILTLLEDPASPLAHISEVLRASVEVASKKLLLHYMITKPWCGIKNSSPWVVFYYHLCCQTKFDSPLVVKAPKQWKILFLHVEEAREMLVFCSPSQQSHCPVQSGPWLCCDKSWESLGSSALSIVCFVRFVSGITMAAQIPCSSPFIIILQICSVFLFLLV